MQKTISSLLWLSLFACVACTQQTGTVAPQSNTVAASGTGAIATAAGGPNSPPAIPANVKWVKLTPFTTIQTSLNDTAQPTFSDAYTRLIITSDNASGITPASTPDKNPSTFAYQSRTILGRFFFGVHYSINLSAKVTAGTFAATVPLVTMDHVSNSSVGEQFTRVVYHSAENYPLFLVKRDGTNGIVSIQFTVKATDLYQTNIAGILETAQSVAKAVAPQSAVMTTLTQSATKDLANALDKTISQLLATSIDEEQWYDDDIRYWHPLDRAAPTGVAVTFQIPASEGSWTDTPVLTVGRWSVSFADPRPSIFSDIQICQNGPRCAPTFAEAAKIAQSEVKPEEVLSYQLVSNAQSLGTVQAYLKQLDWFSAALTKFAKAAPSDDDVDDFCRSIKSAIASLNLNAVDAGIVTAAVRNGTPLLGGTAVDKMSKRPACGYAVP